MTIFRARPTVLLSCSVVMALLVLQAGEFSPASFRSGTLAFVQTSAPEGSWALGVVVPEGAALASSRRVSWQTTSNLSASARLPALNTTDGTILLALSAMVGDSSVIQAAAGLFPGSNTWRALAWFVPDIGATPQAYEWTLNSTESRMKPGALVSLSLFREGGVWHYGILDDESGLGDFGPFTNAPRSSFKVGDQEVFALESYTSNDTVLSRMGSAILRSIYLDGDRVTGGFYYLNNWDPAHHPLFVAGGLQAPTSITLQSFPNGTVAWGYSAGWQGSYYSPPDFGYFVPLALLVVVATVSAFLLIHVRAAPEGRRNGRPES